MAMNRQTKRMMQRQGQVDADGAPKTRRRAPTQVAPTREQRTPPRQFLREVRGEMRKVAWPSRQEVANYSAIVLVAVIILTTFVASLDFVFGEAILRLFER